MDVEKLRVEEYQSGYRKSDTPGQATLIALGGGKGGIGKTVIAASLGICIAKLKKRVVLVDADLGGANLHTVMGIQKPVKTYLNFHNRDYQDLNDVLLDYPGSLSLRIMCGPDGSLGMANLYTSKRKKFIRHIKTLDADFVILDLGSGSSYDILDFFLSVDQSILLVNPDPLSILESYNFIKQAVFRRVANIIRDNAEAVALIKQIARIETHKKPITMVDLVQKVSRLDESMGSRMESSLNEFHPMILINMLEKDKDEQEVLTIRVAAAEILSVDIGYLGAVHRDETVRQSIRKTEPFMSYSPGCRASRDLADIVVKKMFHNGRFQAFKAKRQIRKKQSDETTVDTESMICTVRCIYWQDCGFKQGGFPCPLQHVKGIGGFHRG